MVSTVSVFVVLMTHIEAIRALQMQQLGSIQQVISVSQVSIVTSMSECQLNSGSEGRLVVFFFCPGNGSI